MASVIANEFSEGHRNVYLSSLIEIGLLLFVISTVINIAGQDRSEPDGGEVR